MAKPGEAGEATLLGDVRYLLAGIDKGVLDVLDAGHLDIMNQCVAGDIAELMG